MFARWLFALALFLLPVGALAQGAPSQTYCLFSNSGAIPDWRPCAATNPLAVTGTLSGGFASTTTQAKVTVAVTSTFQAALASSTTRKGCTVQYVAVAGTKGYVFFGSSTPSDLTTSFQLTAGQAINCSIGGLGVATDQILVTGTGTDIFVISSQ